MFESQAFGGVSFDGLAISGVVNELLNVATVFHDAGYRILVDLGGDITHRADMLIDTGSMPPWAKCIRLAGDAIPPNYDAALVRDAKTDVLNAIPVASIHRYVPVYRALAAGIVSTMEREAVRLLIVENGTLPDNPVYTEALYLAIDEYGKRRSLDKYVLWRDHDLMWSTEPLLYGAYPYPGVRRPMANNKYIHYSVATEWMRHRFEAWAHVPCHVIPNRFCAPEFPEDSAAAAAAFRDAYCIPRNAILIARCTRVIPQKSIERDLRLIDALQRRLAASGDERKVYLFVTGPTNEDAAEYSRLVELSNSFGIGRQVIWADGLLPYNAAFAPSAEDRGAYSVSDLLVAADLSSFLTTFDYEGFGNPPGEAMACGVPYIATSYELYQDVYGKKGAIAPLLSITRDSPADEPTPDYFVDWVLRLLTSGEYRKDVVTKNLAVCHRFFSLAALGEQLRELFGEALLPAP